jgi:hypothetical protein
MTFCRMADRRPVETLVERDDGLVFAMRGSGGGADLPHDLVHAVVETELGIRDGICGCIADGVEWTSMRHVSGRRPPHAAERSARFKRDRTAAVQRAEAVRAEAVADLVAGLARDGECWARRWAALDPGGRGRWKGGASGRGEAGPRVAVGGDRSVRQDLQDEPGVLPDRA